MANRLFQQFRNSLEKQVVELWVKASIGSTGAVTLDAANSKGVSTMVRNSAGKYTITLQDTYQKLLETSCTQLISTGLLTAAEFAVVSEAVATAAAPTVVVQFAAAGVATDMASGTVVRIRITLSNTTAI